YSETYDGRDVKARRSDGAAVFDHFAWKCADSVCSERAWNCVYHRIYGVQQDPGHLYEYVQLDRSGCIHLCGAEHGSGKDQESPPGRARLSDRGADFQRCGNDLSVAYGPVSREDLQLG